MSSLILGGTAEARQLADKLGAGAVLSLAGVVNGAGLGPRIRRGGFGGTAGLAAFLQAGGFRNLIDATHPFAASISQNAHEAASALGMPLLRLERPAWPAMQGWLAADTLAAAALALPTGARVFLSVGSRSLGPFLERGDIWCLARSIEPPVQAPRHGTVLLQRPPFTLANERALLARHAITHLVSKNAGGMATQAKLQAAAQLGVQVIMVKRPRLPAALTVETVAKAVKWVENQGD